MILKTLLVAALAAGAAAPSPAPVSVPAGRGAQLMSENRYAEAIPHLEREARDNPGSPAALLNLGWSYWHARRLADAWRVASTLVKLDPGNRRFLIFMANTNIEMGRHEEAVRLMRRALRAHRGDQDASMVLARALFRTGRENEAMRIVEALIASTPDDPAPRYRKAIFLSDMGRKREALALLEELLAKAPEDAAFRRSRARLLSELGRQEEAKNEWKRLTRKSLDAQSLMNLGWSYWRENNLEAAWEIAVTLVKLDDRNPAFLRFMANLEMERQNDGKALLLAEKTVKLAPDDQDAALTLAQALLRVHRVPEATKVLEREISRHPESRSVRYRWAELLAGSRRYTEALTAFDRLIKEDPANEFFRASRATILYDMGRFDEAIAEWKARADLPTPDMAAVRRLRDDALNRRVWDDAIRWQRRIVESDRRDPSSWEGLALMYIEAGRPSNALWAAERAIAADPVPTNAYYMRAAILEQLEDWGAATVAYEEILRRNPNSIRAVEGLAYTLAAKRDHAGALKNMDRVETLMAPSKSPTLDLHRARVHADAGRTGRAHRILNRIEKDRRPVIPILLYHGLSRMNRGDSIPVAAFRAQMLALKKKGYQTITVARLAAAMKGKAELPAKPLLVTFDDGRVDSYTLADPVLKETGFVATMFVHLSRLRRPYFHSSAEQIAAWHATGRWDTQAHGTQAHDPLPLDGFGRRGHFLPNRMWLPAERRLETLSEYRLRIEKDYVDAKQGVEEIIPGHEVTAFAFPFGDFGQNDFSNTEEASGLNQALVRKEYQLAFVQQQQGVNYLDSNPTDLKRYSVPRHMTAEGLVDYLALNDPRVQAKLLHSQLWVRAGQLGRANAVFAELAAMGLEDEPGVLLEKGAVLQRGGDISYARNYFTRAVERQADPQGSDAAAARERAAQADRAAAPVAAAELQRFTDSDRNAITKAFARGGGVVRAFRLDGWAGAAEYSEGRDPSAPTAAIQSREGGASLRWYAPPSLQLDGSYIRRQFSGGHGFADNYTLTAAWQAAPSLRLAVRDGVGTVETAAGIRASRKFHANGAGLAWDPALNWRLNADYDQSRYNDSNRQHDFRARVTKYMSERLSLGAAFYHGESRRRQADYYTPGMINQYTAVARLGDGFGAVSPVTGLAKASAMLQYEIGYGVQEARARRTHALTAELGLRLTDYTAITVNGQYAQSPTYISRRGGAVFAVSF